MLGPQKRQPVTGYVETACPVSDGWIAPILIVYGMGAVALLGLLLGPWL